mmetsp:Transcript_11948/g.43674  ORF Transcript_11948/g.43674 Transcript_11948/m.43674 type:complete len:150 (-) Transcript_11948:172-621(-)|eukprot:scaffold6039_cov384-Prasinococcus_capsulatus_cf.AAC.1
MASISASSCCSLRVALHGRAEKSRVSRLPSSVVRPAPVTGLGRRNVLASFRRVPLTVRATAPVEPARTRRLTKEEKELALDQAEQLRTALESEPRRYSSVHMEIGGQVGITFQVTNQPQFIDGDVERITKTIVDVRPPVHYSATTTPPM